MATILSQLGVDYTFWIKFAIFCMAFILFPRVFFRPYLKLIQDRRSKTEIDLETAKKLDLETGSLSESYRAKIHEERNQLKVLQEKVIKDAKGEESRILDEARKSVKQTTELTFKKIQEQNEALRKPLEADAEGLAMQVTDTLLKKVSV